MQLAAVPLARVLGYIEVADLNPRGAVFFPALIQKLVERFEFQKFPRNFEETDENKGIEFLEGRWNGINVSKLAIFTGAVIVDTNASTAHSETILEESLAWAATDCGINYKPGMIKRKQYVSDVTFYSDVQLLAAHQALRNLRKSLTDQAETYFGRRLEYELTHLGLDFDHTLNPLVAAPFSIQRRGNALFSENKYFSEAALPTHVHIKLLEQFEADLSG